MAEYQGFLVLHPYITYGKIVIMRGETQLTRNILREFLSACCTYSGHERQNEWQKQMVRRFGPQLGELAPHLITPSNRRRASWVADSLEPNNAAKMAIIYPRYDSKVSRLIFAMTEKTASVCKIEHILEDMSADAIIALMCMQS